MAKNGKTYSITEAQLEDMIKKASEAGAEAYKKEQSQSTRRKVDRMLYKTKVLLEKYTWLKAYAKNSVYTLEQAEKVNDGMADIEVLTKFGRNWQSNITNPGGAFPKWHRSFYRAGA